MTFCCLSSTVSVFPCSIQNLIDVRHKALEHNLDSCDVRVLKIYIRALSKEAAVFVSKEESEELALKARTITLGKVDIALIDRVVSVYKKVYIFRFLTAPLEDWEKKEVVCLIWHLVKHEDNMHHIESLAFEVARLNQDDRRSVCFILSRFFSDIRKWDEVMGMLDRVKGIPIHERDRVCDLALEFIDQSAPLDDKILMIDFLLTIPIEIRVPLCRNVSTIVHPLEDVHQFCTIGKILITAPSPSLVSLTREFIVLFKAGIAGSLKSRLIDLLASVKSNELLSFIKIVQGVFTLVFDEEEVLEIVHTLNTKPIFQRLKVFALAMRVVEGLAQSKIGPILCSCIKLGINNLENLVSAAGILSKVVVNEHVGYDALEDRSTSVLLLCKVPAAERIRLVELVLGFFEETTCVAHFTILLEICGRFEAQERECILRIISSYVLPLKSPYQKERVLECIFYIDKESREDFCFKIMKFCPVALLDVDRVDFIEKFTTLYKNYSFYSLKWIFKIAKSSSYEECMELVDLFKAVPQDHVATLCKIMHRLCAEMCSQEHKLRMLKLIKKISPAERSRWFRASFSMIEKLQCENKAFVVFYGLRYIPFSMYLRYTSFINHYVDSLDPMLGHTSLIHVFLQNNTDCVESFHHVLDHQLRSTIDRMEASALASEIIKNQNEFMIENESSLYQLAVSVYLLSTEEHHSKNPYVVFDGHLASSLLPKTHVTIPTVRYLKKYIKINFSVFEQLDRGEISFDDMRSFYEGSPVTPLDWSGLLRGIESRIESLSVDVRGETKEYILASCGARCAELIANFSDPYIYSLLDIDEKEMVPKTKVLFGAIARFIVKHPDTLRQGELLSDREEAFFKMSASIQNCPAGKAEGLILAYNQLDARDKLTFLQQDQATELSSKVKARCIDLLHKKMEELISSDGPMMREMIGIDGEILQLSHQSLYVKNKISHFVGLNHQMQFDLHTHVLYQSLVDRQEKDLIQIFTKYATVAFFAKELMLDFKVNNKTDPLYVGYTDLVAGSVSSGKMWDVSSEDFDVGLTEAGALAIIERLDLVHLVDPRVVCVTMFAAIVARGIHHPPLEEEVSSFPCLFKELILCNIPILSKRTLPHFSENVDEVAGVALLYDPSVSYSFKTALMQLAIMDLFIQMEGDEGNDFLSYILSLLDNATMSMIINFLTKEGILHSRFGLFRSLSRADLLRKLKDQLIYFYTTDAFL